MKLTPVLVAALALCLLAGCVQRLTLEEARALCKKQGGFLTVIYTQKITRSGVGEEIASPGDCVSPEKFDLRPPAPNNAPVPAN